MLTDYVKFILLNKNVVHIAILKVNKDFRDLHKSSKKQKKRNITFVELEEF